MKTERQLIEDLVNDPGIREECKFEEREKLKICNECPDKNDCWDCGCHRWWEK